MGKNKQYAKQLKEMEGYERKIIAFKLCDEVPETCRSMEMIFILLRHCCRNLEDGESPFISATKYYVRRSGVHRSRGEAPDQGRIRRGMSQTIGENKAYATRQVMRRVNQQIPHHFIHHKYQIVGALEDVDAPDVVMVVADANRVMRLCKVYTWKTGELVHGLSGTAWCNNSFRWCTGPRP